MLRNIILTLVIMYRKGKNPFAQTKNVYKAAGGIGDAESFICSLNQNLANLTKPDGFQNMIICFLTLINLC